MNPSLGTAISAAVLAVLVAGCTTLEQKADAIRAQETVLFEGYARVGRILNTGDHIAWDPTGVLPVLATVNSLHIGNDSWPYNWVRSVEVGSFHAAAEMFIRETDYDDVMILRRNNDWPNGGDVFLFIPEGGTWNDPLGAPARRAISTRAVEVIRARKEAVDPFGQAGLPRPVWLASPEAGRVFEYWSTTPRYLDLHFGEQRRAFDALFKSARPAATDAFAAKMRPLLSSAAVETGSYRFVDIGELDIDWLGHRKIQKRLGERDPWLESLVVVDTVRVSFEEKLDPQGNPRVKARFACAVRYYDTELSRLASNSAFSHEVVLPLQTWLDRGENGILSEIDAAMQVIAGQIDASLNQPHGVDEERP